MKVKELIAVLQSHDPEALVFVRTLKNGLSPPTVKRAMAKPIPLKDRISYQGTWQISLGNSKAKDAVLLLYNYGDV